MAPFVGRARVLADLERFVCDAAAGAGGLRLVAGEPGIGKTALVAELAARTPAVRAVWGSCWEGAGAPALWPWTQILRGVARGAVAEPRAAAPARPLPGASAIGTSDAPADERARFELFDGVATALLQAAADQPLLLVLDDLHWADTATLDLLGFLLPELRTARLAVVGTYRDGEVPPGHLLHRSLTTRTGVLRLAGLDADEVRELMRALGGDAPAPGAAETIHRTTGGNPFFVGEMLRNQDHAALPESVGEVIRQRVARLSAPARALLGAAAVIGHEVRLDVLSRVVDTTAVTEPLAARLLEPDPSASGQLRFAHAVVREVLHADLHPDVRRALHRRVGEALESLGGSEPSTLAHHFAQCGSADTAGKAAAYAERAGEQSMRLFAYQEAAGHFERALSQVPPAGGGAAHVRLLFALGRALHAAGRIPEAHAAFEQVAQRTSDPTLLAAAALAFAVEFTAGVVDPTEIRLLERALAELPAEDHPMRARVLARLAKALLFTPAAARRVELSEAAAAMARRLGDPATLAAVLFDRHVAIWAGANAEERLAIAGEVVELATRCHDDALALQGRALRLGNLLELGDTAALQSEIETYAAITAGLRQPQYLWHAPFLRATLAVFACDFAAAERLAAEGLALAQEAQHQGGAVFHASVVAALRLAQGRFGELAPVLRRGVEAWPSLVVFRTSAAFAAALAGRHEEARLELERLTADELAVVPRDFTWVGNLAMLSSAAAALDYAPAAERVYPLLLPYRNYCVRLTRIGVCGLGAVEHYLGLLAATMARWSDARAHLERAVEINARIGAPAFVANSRHHLALVLRALGETARADEQARRAQLAAETLGITPFLGGASPAPPVRVSEGVFCKEGDYRTVGFRGGTFRMRESLGAAYIARLLAEPEREVHVLELSGAEGDGDATPVLDARAKADFRRRLELLEEAARAAEARGEPLVASRAREEIDLLADELARAVGLGGRDRSLASPVERARVRVTKAIKAAIRRITPHDPALAQHLEVSIRTGVFCRYAPDPSVRIAWRT